MGLYGNMLKIALISYHKNVIIMYPNEWLIKHRESILNQTYKQFDVYELEYGGGKYRIFDESVYESKELPTFVDAMNYLLDKCFSLGYDYVCNLNSDDNYTLNRVEKQLFYMEQGIDLISSNFALVRDDQIIHTHHFENLDIKRELSLNNNIVCHPVVAYSRKFWEQNKYVPSEIPEEDMLLWKRAINNGMKFKILEDVLCFHRLHDQSVCQSNNR